MATVRTTLNLGITSSSDMKGVDDAQKKLTELKAQLDSLRSQRLDIQANTAQMDEAIARSKAQIAQLQERMRNGELDANDYRVQAKLDELKQSIRDFRNEKIQLNLEDAQLKTEMARLKVELDDLTHDRKIKIDGDTTGLEAKLAAASALTKQETKDMQDAWQKSATNMRQSSLTLAQAIALIAPAAVPIAATILGVGASAASAFTSGALAAGVFGFTLKSTWADASKIASTNETLNQSLGAQRALLATLTPGSAQYNSVQRQIASTQQQITANLNSEGPVIAQIAQRIGDLTQQWDAARNKMLTAGGGAAYLNSAFLAMSQIIRVMPQIFAAVSAALEPMREKFNEFFMAANNKDIGAGLKGLVNWVIAYGVPNFLKFVEVIHNIGVAFAQMVSAFSGNGATMMSWLVRITGELDKWGAGGGFVRFTEYIKSVAPQVTQTLASIGLALQHLTVAAQGVSIPSLTALTVALDLIAHLPVQAIQAVYIGFVAYKGLNFLGALFQGVRNGVEAVHMAMAASREAIIAFQVGLQGANAAAADSTIAKVGIAIGSAWSSGVTAAKGVLMAFRDGLRGASVAADEGTTAILANKVALVAHAAATGISTAATKAWELAQTAFSLATSRSTYALIAQKVATLAQAVAEGISTAATWAWDAAMGVADAVGAPVILVIGAIVVAVGLLIAGIRLLVTHWTTVWNTIKSVAETVWTALQSKWGWFLAFFAPPIGILIALIAHWHEVWDAMKTAASAVWDFMKAAWGVFLSVIQTIWDSVSSSIKTAWDFWWNVLKTIAEQFWSIFKSEWSAFWSIVQSVAKVAWDLLKTAFSIFWQTLRLLWTVFKDFFTGDWSGLWNTVKSVAVNIWNDIKSGFSSFWNDIVSGIQNAVNKIGQVWSKVVDVFRGPVNDLIGIWNTVAGAIGLPKIGTIGGTSGSSGGGGSVPAGGASSAPVAAGAAAGSGGPVRAFASGGRITGPGTGTSDSIPIWASHGEFMMPADAVQHYGLNLMESMRSKRFAKGGIISHDDAPGYVGGGIIRKIWNTGKKVVGTVGGAVTGPLKALEAIPGVGGLVSKLVGVAATAVYDVTKPVVDALVNSIPDPIAGIFKPAGSVPKAGVKTLGDELLAKLKAAQAQAQAVMAAMGGTIPTGQHKAIIDQALAKAGIPQSQWPMWEAGLNTLITRESSWNPNAINLTDSNAAAGHPSQGLMQTVPSTFAAYSLGGSITDPLSNIVAGIRYIMAKYGGIQNVQQANANMPPKGYDTGGPLPRGLTLVNNTTGTMEGVLNPTGLNAIGGLGALSALNSGKATFMSATASSATSGGGAIGGGGRTVTISMPIEINAPNADASQVVDEVERRIIPKLTTILTAGVGTQ